MKHIFSLLIGIAGLLAPWVSFGSDATQQQSTLYPFSTVVEIQEDFISGTTTSGSIGMAGWGALNGTTTVLAPELNRPGIIRSETTAVSGTIRGLTLSVLNANIDVANTTYQYLTIHRLNTNDANTTARIGFLNSFTTNPPTSGIYFEKLDADTNWFCVLRGGGVETRVNTGIAVSTSFANFTINSRAATVTFLINNADTACGAMTTNYPVTDFTPGHQIVNSAAANKTLDIDYAQLRVFVTR